MPRHAASSKQHVHRSRSAELAHRANLVTGTIDLSALPALTARQRAMTTAARHGIALGIVATGVWIYDIARVLRGV